MQYIVRLTFPAEMNDATDKYLLDAPEGLSFSILETDRGKMKKVRYNVGNLPPHERVACEILENARRPLTTREVAEYGNMSWLTAKKHLESLRKRDIGIQSKNKGRSKLWFIEREI